MRWGEGPEEGLTSAADPVENGRLLAVVGAGLGLAGDRVVVGTDHEDVVAGGVAGDVVGLSVEVAPGLAVRAGTASLLSHTTRFLGSRESQVGQLVRMMIN